MKHEYDIPELYAIYLETSELVRNRPDAVCTPFKGKGRSIYQRKLANIKQYAEGMHPRSATEKAFLETILGRELPKTEVSVKVEWFQQIKLMN